ncbi:MAG: helix-turn-helix domain-containing protein [Parafannyhessea sp.]|uniref:helix-turn-helix domain-containing protein n=1 Tax=Parafannyhessea sp. TaxID=2847324 RepID=UPI003F1231B2
MGNGQSSRPSALYLYPLPSRYSLRTASLLSTSSLYSLRTIRRLSTLYLLSLYRLSAVFHAPFWWRTPTQTPCSSPPDDAARRLGVGCRTLQRKLDEEGTTFQRQLNHTRELLAKHYLKTTATGTDQIAYLLGYLELNSFLRAFGSWCSMSPSEWRNRNT